jgi:hypothetical protein
MSPPFLNYHSGLNARKPTTNNLPTIPSEDKSASSQFLRNKMNILFSPLETNGNTGTNAFNKDYNTSNDLSFIAKSLPSPLNKGQPLSLQYA